MAHFFFLVNHSQPRVIYLLMLYVTLSLFFVIGYAFIIFESFLNINKAASAILLGVISWIIFFAFQGKLSPQEFADRIANIAQIIFFLIAAMAIVELIDAHHGFKMITDIIYTSSPRRMLWFLVIISFFMSSVLDNLTTMIVMISLLKKMVPDRKERWMLGSLIVIAVNAGGAWTPIGDVTTTLLWVNEKISTLKTIKALFIPSVVNVVAATLCATFLIPKKSSITMLKHKPMEPGAKRVLFMGIGALIMIPVWKGVLGLPPFMGALIGLGVLWLVTDLIHRGSTREHLRLPSIFAKIDTSGILFFLGILLAVDALAQAGILKDLALVLEEVFPNQNYVAYFIGIISSIVDNIPLVAATFGMYDLPMDHTLWQLIAYAAGTGGSILIIGSAAGVAFMGLEKVDFIWYTVHIAWIAFIGYTLGFLSYFLFV